MNSIIGSISLTVAVVVAVGTAVTSVFAAVSRSERLTELGRHGVYVVFAALLVASAALLNALLTHDFSIEYVQRYTDVRMPPLYLAAAFWGGQSGSLLFWAVVLAGSAAIAVTTARRRAPDLMPWVHALLMVITAFFLFLLIFVSDPFETYYLIGRPAEGSGLNPILQSYWMTIHPPALLAGYSLFAVPFAFGVAAMIKGRFGGEWLEVSRRWILLSWLFLSMGNILGARWAYEELGWGGYWAWDPVENAGLLPWFTGTALIHSVIIQQRRGMLKRWTFTLLLLTFWLTIFGTFLTRSGMIASVHSFAASSIGPVLLVLVIAIAVISLGLLAWRWVDMRGERALESYVSRESIFVLNNWVMIALMFIVLWGTVGPKLNDLVTGEDTVLGPEWFNRLVLPFGLALLLIMGVGTLIAWRRTTASNFRRSFLVPMMVAGVVSPALGWIYWTFRLQALGLEVVTNNVVMACLVLPLSVFGSTVILQELYRGSRTRMKREAIGFVMALWSLMKKHRRRYGGYLVHLGFILACVGIAGGAFKIGQTGTLAAGESVLLGDYIVTFNGLEEEFHSDKYAVYANLTMRRCALVDGVPDLGRCGEVRTLRPAHFDFNDTGRSDPMKRTTEAAIHTTPLEDVYVTMTGWRPSRGQSGALASFEMNVTPFVFWLWYGGVIMIISLIFGMWPDSRHRGDRSPVMSPPRRSKDEKVAEGGSAGEDRYRDRLAAELRSMD